MSDSEDSTVMYTTDPADYLADHDDDDKEEEPSGDNADEEDKEQDEDYDGGGAPNFGRLYSTSTCTPSSPPILPIPLPTASPTLQLLSFDRRADRLEVPLPPRKRLSIVHCPVYEAGEKDIGYGIRDTWIDPRDVADEETLATLEGVTTKVTELAAVQEQDTHDIYGVMEDTLGRQIEIFQRVEALVDHSQYHYETGRLVDQEARCSREAWENSIGLSSAGHLAMALGKIRALQAREQARAGAPQGASSST
nr:hypothetical protein [Tanacetum cinerariifolium]